jgi:hypothetical protein
VDRLDLCSQKWLLKMATVDGMAVRLVSRHSDNYEKSLKNSSMSYCAVSYAFIQNVQELGVCLICALALAISIKKDIKAFLCFAEVFAALC